MKHECDGDIIREVTVDGRRFAVLGYHFDSSDHASPFDYWHINEIVTHQDGTTEIMDEGDPIGTEPTDEDVRVFASGGD